ncbi:DNA polymerase IV [Candidatus Sumerlaeota bacterium]|nr:DNA polymerase IV [Candidatus Sumerlaeota bacterium]
MSVYTPEQRQRIVAHVDMDCFYVSVERLLNPKLNGIPVAVGGSPDGRGVVASCSYEARKFGVRSAMPMAKALQLCPKLTIVSGSFSRYSEFSRKVHETLCSFSPLVQMASQDEAYIDLTGTERLWGAPLSAAQMMREAVLKATQLPCSLGIATNKLVAKVASSLCKPAALLYIPPGSEASFFRRLPVDHLPGVGVKSARTLREIGVETLGDLASFDTKRLAHHFGDQAENLQARARGENNSPIVNDVPARQVSAETTFDRDSVDRDFLFSVLSGLAEKVASRMRRDDCRASTIVVKYRYNNFETHTASMTLSEPTDDEGTLLDTARALFSSRWNNRPIRLLGVAGTNLVFERRQLDILAIPAEERKEKLHKAVDALRGKHGYGIVKRGSSAID